MVKQPLIDDLALLSDRNTCAVMDRAATIQWYCPSRYDGDSCFSSLVDPAEGGYWAIHIDEAKATGRAYVADTSILNNHFVSPDETVTTLRDWMPMHDDYRGIMRQFLGGHALINSTLRMYNSVRSQPGRPVALQDNMIAFKQENLFLICSHPIHILDDSTVNFSIPKGEEGWAFLTDRPCRLDVATCNTLYAATESRWQDISGLFDYEGLYRTEVLAAVRAIQQLTCGVTGGVLAAATTSLPEVIGGGRNYDYRYVWVRDAALITGALSTLDVEGKVEVKFLEFMYQAMRKNNDKCVYPLYTIDHELINHLEELPADGYEASRPVQIGNIAGDQRQLDAEANILISAKIIYDKYGERYHWETVRRVANHIAKNWALPCHGIWEEETALQYTCGKVFAAIGLDMISKFTEDAEEKERWLAAAKAIRTYVAENCLTAEGAFANYAGSQEVDVSAALYVLWNYTAHDSKEMLATVKKLEEKYAEGNLYRRTLVEFDSAEEGMFLAGSCWMAHYYAIAENFDKCEAILQAVQSFQNDLGFFSEEADLENGRMLGNFAQTFVQSSFICAANALSRAREGVDTVTR